MARQRDASEISIKRFDSQNYVNEKKQMVPKMDGHVLSDPVSRTRTIAFEIQSCEARARGSYSKVQGFCVQARSVLLLLLHLALVEGQLVALEDVPRLSFVA